MEALAWSIGGVIAFRSCGRGVGRTLGLVVGAGLAHLGWIVVHLVEISKVAETAQPLALASQILDPSAGASMLFVPAGPILVRWVRRDPRGELDADLRALMSGLAVARLGCVFAGCCGGRAGLPVLDAFPTAELSVGGLALLSCVAKRTGRAPLALAGFGALRLVLQPLRTAPPHGGETAWVYVLAAMWLVGGLGWLRSRRPRRSPREPARSSCRGPWRRRLQSPCTSR